MDNEASHSIAAWTAPVVLIVGIVVGAGGLYAFSWHTREAAPASARTPTPAPFPTPQSNRVRKLEERVCSPRSCAGRHRHTHGHPPDRVLSPSASDSRLTACRRRPVRALKQRVTAGLHVVVAKRGTMSNERRVTVRAGRYRDASVRDGRARSQRSHDGSNATARHPGPSLLKKMQKSPLPIRR